MFLRLLRMLIVPLVFFTLVSGVTRMESPESLSVECQHIVDEKMCRHIVD